MADDRAAMDIAQLVAEHHQAVALEILEEMTRLLPVDELRGMLGDNASEIARLMPD